jgi:predicted SAM-dependent methyltransferase
VAIPAEGLRLNLGSGRHSLDGWCNVDAAVSPRASRPPDILCDVKSIPLPDGCAREIMGIHIFEHLYRWECDEAIEEWRRLLRKSGLLVLEMPDLFKFCRNILEGRTGKAHTDQLGMWGLYGDPRDRDPLMIHHWGWTFATIKPFLQEHGFTDAKEERTQWHKVGQDVRDFRVTARKA